VRNMCFAFTGWGGLSLLLVTTVGFRPKTGGKEFDGPQLSH
jgi:hypothetical protein